MNTLNKYNDIVSRLAYDLEAKVPMIINDDILQKIRIMNNPSNVKERFDDLKEDPHKKEEYSNIELVGSIYDHNTLYISVKIHDPSIPEIENKVIIGCTGTNDRLFQFEISNDGVLLPSLGEDWENNINGIGFQLPEFGSDDCNSAFYKDVINWIHEEQNQNEVISITGHSRGGFFGPNFRNDD